MTDPANNRRLLWAAIGVDLAAWGICAIGALSVWMATQSLVVTLIAAGLIGLYKAINTWKIFAPRVMISDLQNKGQDKG